MSTPQPSFSKFDFVKTFLLPALTVFLIPTLTLLFFLHAQNRFDYEARRDVLHAIQINQTLQGEERARLINFYTSKPMSELLLDPDFARRYDSTGRFYYATFRWMIRLSFWSIAAGVLVFLLGGLFVALSLRSQFFQYVSLSAGWHLLRIFSALQTVAQGSMLVALSFWVTALWFNFYSVKLILMGGILALIGVAVVLKGIFTSPRSDFTVEGKVIDRDHSSKLWHSLEVICDRVGTKPPDHVIAGIDDNFFVTEHPVTVDGIVYRGRTLFISLALLKHLQSAEADAVLAHEMAHFSGNDTVYSRKISPLLSRYNNYLDALAGGGVTLPIFYFMNCFRALFEISLGSLSRQREFRADRIAADATSAQALAGGLLRTTAYSRYRTDVENELFNQERALQNANIAQRVEQGFPHFAVGFASNPDLANSATAHPFDSHPPLASRLEAVGLPRVTDAAQSLLARPGDGGWYRHIAGAEEMEREQWNRVEANFRDFHEQTLPYRFLPSNDEELAIVLQAFPELQFDGKDGPLFVDYQQFQHPTWAGLVFIRDIKSFDMDENGVLTIHLEQSGKKRKELLKTARFAEKDQAVDAIDRYSGRYFSAVAYQQSKGNLP